MSRVSRLAVVALLLVGALFSESVARAGVVGGGRYGNDIVPAFARASYEMYFRGGELARVEVNGDHTTDLDVLVFDRWGNLVAEDVDDTDYCVVSWVPPFTGEYRIVIVNHGDVYNRYHMETN